MLSGVYEAWQAKLPYMALVGLTSTSRSSNFACMGLATAGAFGGKAGCPDRQVICVTGDGAFQMQLQELPDE